MSPKGLLRKRGPAPEKRRDGAPRGAAHRKRCAHIRNGCAARRAVPLAVAAREKLEKLGRAHAPRERWSMPA